MVQCKMRQQRTTHTALFRPMPTANCFGHCLVQLCWHTNKNLGVAINPCKINSEVSTGVIDLYHFGYCCFTFAISLSLATWTASFSNWVRLFGESLTNLDAVISETTSVCCISCTAWKPCFQPSHRMQPLVYSVWTCMPNISQSTSTFHVHV